MSLDVYLEIDKCEHCGYTPPNWTANITHNLGNMAEQAGIYEIVWHPEDNGIEIAEQLIEPLLKGIERMEAEPECFKKFDAPNGWGTYNDFLPWLKNYVKACEANPKARVAVSR